MILCSQAKLENDNKGLNVQRGLRTKCAMGWRPGIAPAGYLNKDGNGHTDPKVTFPIGGVATIEANDKAKITISEH